MPARALVNYIRRNVCRWRYLSCCRNQAVNTAVAICKEESLSKEHLATYLNDHLAGANFAVELLDHLISENTHLKPGFDALKKDIEEDREQLRILMGI